MASIIPLAGLDSEPVTDASKPQKSTLSPSDVRVLLVDDERLSRTVVSSLLRRCNYSGKLKFKPLQHEIMPHKVHLIYLSIN